MLRTYDPDDQNADGTYEPVTPSLLSILSSPTVASLGDTYMVPTPEETNILNVLSGGTPTLTINSNTLPLIVPGPQVLSSAPGITFTGTLTDGSETITGVLSAAITGGEPAAGLVAGQETDRRRHSSGRDDLVC